MKRLFPILLCLMVLFCACVESDGSAQATSIIFYFPSNGSANADSTLVHFHSTLKPDSTTPDTLLEHFLSATPPQGATPALPDNWTVSEIEEDGANIYLTIQGGACSPVVQSMACACLAKTLLQLPQVQRVSFSLPGKAEPVVLSGGDILLTDTGMLPQEETVVLYFPDEARRYLTRQTVIIDGKSAENKPACIMEQLIEKDHNNSCIPKGTELLDIQVDNGICTVNLSSQFQENLEKSFTAERMAVYAIVNSLTELPEINSVDFQLAGAPLDQLYQMDLSSGVVRDERIVVSPLGKNIADITLYPVCDSNGLLAQIPICVELAEGQRVEEAAIDSLIAYEGINGMESCIPTGTKVLSIRLEKGNCTLDLTAEFLDGCSSYVEERLAVRSVIATMCKVRGINSVDILVEGLEPTYRLSLLSKLHRANEQWITN